MLRQEKIAIACAVLVGIVVGIAVAQIVVLLS
jgi:hypothetical protein